MNLALCSFLFALDQFPDLDLPSQMRRLDSLAAQAPPQLREARGAEEALSGLADYLYSQQGFHGSQDAYDSAAGYFLHNTLERRTGLPITLCTVYLEVGWRLGLPLAGIGMPGHFILAYEQPGVELVEDRLYCDPFHGGRLLSASDCQALLRMGLGAGLGFRPEFLAPTSRRAILYRMLNNLKALYLQTSDTQKALWATDRMLLVQPSSAKDVRDRGLLYLANEQYGHALSDLISYLSLLPDAADRDLIHEQLSVARARSGLLN